MAESIMQEEWKPIPGYQGRYEVSNLGRVRSSTFTVWQVNRWGKVAPRVFPAKEIQGSDNGNGYQYITARLNGKKKNLYIHRLVAELFVPNPNNFPVVDHLDFNKSNNAFYNLEWVTQKENVNRARPRMSKPHKVSSRSSTGEKYIYKKRNRYRLCIPGVKDQRFDSLNEAILERGSILGDE